MRGVDAEAVPLQEFHLGINSAMMKEKINKDLVSDDALKLLKVNNLVKEEPDGRVTLLPKGNQLLNEIREKTAYHQPKMTSDEQKELFAKYIPEVKAEPKAEVKAEEPAKEAGPQMPIISDDEFYKLRKEHGLGEKFPMQLEDMERSYVPAGFARLLEDQLYKNHGRQSYEDLARRGGMHPAEMLAALIGKEVSQTNIDWKTAPQNLAKVVQEYEADPEGFKAKLAEMRGEKPAEVKEEAKPEVKEKTNVVSENEMDEVHHAQRVGKGLDVVPENMMSYRHNPGINNSGKYQHAAEHIGDLVHRLSSTNKNQGGGHKYGISAALSKATSRYDYADMLAQVKRNAEHAVENGEAESIEAFIEEFKDAAKRYAEAYKKIPVYTEFQRLGRDAAIALGELRFNDTQRLLKELEEKLNANNVEQKYFERETAKAEKTEAIKKEAAPEEAKPEVKVTENKIFTEDAATKARNRLRAKLNRLNSGIDPEFLLDGITLSGYHIEKGARTFSAYAKAMIEDLGDRVKPYLKQWYNAVRDDPAAESLADSMDSYEDVKKAELPSTKEGMDLMDPSGKFEISKLISATMTGANPTTYKTILEARAAIEKMTGQKIQPGTAEAKEADEAIETAVVLAARDIIEENKRSGNEEKTYDDLVALYNRQPNLSVRSSTSIEQQAYSTPAPLAYIASQLAGINNKTTVLEPTAGNGMLLIDADPKKVVANELNATRFETLKRVMDGAEVLNDNATSLLPVQHSSMDVVIANPPFGTFKDKEGKQMKDLTGHFNYKKSSTFLPYDIGEIDHVISFMSLSKMKEDGRAVLIVGGVMGKTEDARRENYRGKAKRLFYSYLYEKYNVVDHFTAAGDLYKKQGASFPVDVIVINGVGKSERALPAADLPKVYTSYEQLKEKLDEASRMESRGPIGASGVNVGAGTARADEREQVAPSPSRQGVEPSATRERPEEGRRPSVPVSEPTEGGRAEPTGTKPSERESKPTDEHKLQRTEAEPVRPRGEGEPTAGRVTEQGKPSELGTTGGRPSERIESRLEDRRGLEKETATQVSYNPKSAASSIGALVPVAMRDSIQHSLEKVEDKVGNLDQYIADSLNMDLNDVKDKFSAEQVDALALAINNAEKGKGFIIGDQTGIGKGRVVAGMIRYAMMNDRIPIFVTEKPNLYADMIRDLDDIGMSNMLGLETDKPKILMTNAGKTIDYSFVRNIKGEPTEVKYSLKPPKNGLKELNNLMSEMMKSDSLGNYKVIFTNYSQVQTQNGELPLRANFIDHFSANNYLILDESHNAGGAGEKTRGEEGGENRAKFVRKLVANAYGSFFSSATYAKRPDVMDLYSSTDMSLAVENLDDLGEAIKHGGVPMQQTVANMLAQAGQYIRRERTFAGIEYNTEGMTVNKQTAENMATAMREILAFSRAKAGAIKELQKDLDREGGVARAVGEKTQIQGVSFGTTMHNLIGQMLLSLKAKRAVEFAIENLKKDQKVVLTVSNTMGSFIKDYATEMEIEVGDPIQLSFRDMYLRYLEKQRWVTIKQGNTKKKYRLTDEDLGEKLTQRFKAIEGMIKGFNFEESPMSPIDYMHDQLRKAGYKTDEITGRTAVINYSSGQPILASRNADIKQRLQAIKSFNNGETDVIILNQSGSTGLSLHASENFKDQRKRHMILVQAEANIDTHMQMLGRINRTGQVTLPIYSQLMADIPAEMRPAAVLLKKMASLNANTTASRKSAVTAEGVVDFMNDYGGQVVHDFLKDNPDVNETLGDIIDVLEDSTEGKVEDIAKLTGYIPVLPLAQQEQVYNELIDRYNELLERENSMGTNKLEAKAVDLDAETISSEPVTEAKEEESIFAEPAYMEQVDVKRTVKPYSSAEVDAMIKENLGDKSAAQLNKDYIVDLRSRNDAFVDKKMEEMREAGADPVKTDATRSQLVLLNDKINSVLRNYAVGDSISVKDTNGIINYGVITAIDNAKRTANPSAGSDWKMHIALANGDARSLTINFSQIGSRFELSKEYQVNWYDSQKEAWESMPVKEIFDKGATVRREKRWMVTGNILAGFAKYPGQIIQYTKKDGTVGQGILMNRQFDFGKAKKEQKVYIKSGADAIKFFQEAGYGAAIGTPDENLRITMRGSQIAFNVPSSKRLGGSFYLDKTLLNKLGTEFYKRGSTMTAVIYNTDTAKEAIDYLTQDRKDKIVALTAVEKARELFAPEKTQAEINRERQEAQRTKGEGGEYYNKFTDSIDESELIKNIPELRKEAIKELAKVRATKTRSTRKIAQYGSDIPMQRELNKLLEIEAKLVDFIEDNKPVLNRAIDFMDRATNAVKEGSLSKEVEQVIRGMYEKYPTLLDGLKLTIGAKTAKEGRAAANFDPYERIVSLYKNTKAITDPTYVRHEVTHSMEQMMGPEAQKTIVRAWKDALEKAIKSTTDEKTAAYFKAVLQFLANPSKESFNDATNIMPDIKLYQFISPSEYWAANAERLFKAQLGTPWNRFVKGIEKLFELLKRTFGFNNTYAVHQVFDQIMKGQQTRTTEETLSDFLFNGKAELNFLNSVEDIDEAMAEFNRPHTKLHPSDSVKERFKEGAEIMKDMAKDAVQHPVQTFGHVLSGVDRGLINARNKAVFFGKGLEVADFKKYNGKLRDSNDMAAASIALTNVIHAGHIGTQVLMKGYLSYNDTTGQFQAIDSKNSVGNIIKIKHDLMNKIGAQRATDLIQGYLEAKRSKSILAEYLNREAEYEDAIEAGEDVEQARQNLQTIEKAVGKISMSDEAIDRFIAFEKTYPELRKIMDQWNAVTQNLINMKEFSSLISKRRAKVLRAIEDYVPWQREMDEEGDIDTPAKGIVSKMVRGLTNVAKEKVFKNTKPLIVKNFLAKNKEQVYDIVANGEPKIEVNGESLGEDEYEINRNEGTITIKRDINAGDKVKFSIYRPINDMVDNMIANVMSSTRRVITNYGANRIAMEYGTRRMVYDKKTGTEKPGKLMVFAKEGITNDGAVRTNIIANGQRIVIEFKDPLIAEAVTGLENVEIPMNNIMGFFAQGLRRGVTLYPWFQLKQMVLDAPTAAWVSGVKNPFAVWAGTFTSFLHALNPNDPIVKMFKSYGIGGYQASFRTPEKEIKMELGLINKSWFSYLMRGLDHIGDASDYAQRRSVYKQVLKETGDEMQALLQANNIIDFLKHGSSATAQAMTRNTAFMNAYAQQIDVLAEALAGGGLKGKKRLAAQKQMAITGALLAGTTIIYCMLKGDDDDYWNLDDQTRVRNYILPKGWGIEKIPMNTSASFLYKAIPELLYHKIMKNGTKNEMDWTRLRRAMGKAAVDQLLGPNVMPTLVKPMVEIGLNHNFLTGGDLTPDSLKNLDVSLQYNAATSEFGKIMSKMLGGLLNPIEADHLVRSLFGTTGAAVMWMSDLVSGNKPSPLASQNPIYGAWMLPPQPRGKEDLLYDFHEKTRVAHDTYEKLQQFHHKADAQQWFKEHQALIRAYGYTSQAMKDIQDLNAEIRRVSNLPPNEMGPTAKRLRMLELNAKKDNALRDIQRRRVNAGL